MWRYKSKMGRLVEFIKTHLDTVPFSYQAEVLKKELNVLCRSILPEKRLLEPDQKKNISAFASEERQESKFFHMFSPVSLTI